jgi:hypothetical protein
MESPAGISVDGKFDGDSNDADATLFGSQEEDFVEEE